MIIATLAAAIGCAVQEEEASPALQKLQAAVDQGRTMYAMQDAVCYGKDWHPAPGDLSTIERSDVADVCGDLPAIIGFDLGEIEYQTGHNIDGVYFDYMRAAALKHAEKGGIVTLSWHMRNPLTGGDAWDVSSDKVVASVLEGGECHETFMSWLSLAADFIDSLRLEDGSLIPIIFRPWHENTGSWFWWGEDLCTDEQYQALWQLTYDCLVKERGLEGMAWAYSPSSTLLKECAMGRYPGDEILDIIGVDRYYMAHVQTLDEGFIRAFREDLEFLSGVAQEHGLLLAVTETGQEGGETADWWTAGILDSIEGLGVSYVLTWRNAWDKEGHFFAPYTGAPCEQDFVKFYKSPKTIFLNDLQ